MNYIYYLTYKLIRGKKDDGYYFDVWLDILGGFYAYKSGTDFSNGNVIGLNF